MFEIYRLISLSKKSYIGLTSIGVTQRFKRHVHNWKYYHKPGVNKLYDAFSKYPPETWTNEILYVTDIKEEAEQKEIDYIKQFNSIEQGYNILVGGNLSRYGLKNSQEFKDRHSKAMKGRKLPKTTEWRENIRKAMIGKKLPEVVKAKMRGKIPWNKGVPCSEETKRKIRLKQLGVKRGPHPEEWRVKLRKPKKSTVNMKHSEEWKINNGLRMKRIWEERRRLKNIVIILICLLLSSCALNQGENRKITAWGIWCTYSVCGIGYWHSERGVDVESEQSSKPEDSLRIIK